MSIIERMVELLGSAPQAARKPAVGDASRRFPAGKDPAEKPKAEIRPGRPASRTTQTHTIGQDQLRRQGIITPTAERTPMAECFRYLKRQILTNVANPKTGAPSNL